MIKYSLRILLILCFFINSQLIFSQESKDLDVNLKFHLLPAITVGIPRMQGSVEFLYKKKVGLEVGYGKRYRDKSFFFAKDVDTLTANTVGEIFLLDLNIYNVFNFINVHKKNMGLDHYVGLSFKNLYDYKNKMSSYYPPGDDLKTQDCYAFKRVVQVYSIKVGVIVSYKRLSIEGFGEFGIRDIRRNPVGNEIDFTDFPTDSGLWFWGRPYNGILPNINFGLKLCFRII